MKDWHRVVCKDCGGRFMIDPRRKAIEDWNCPYCLSDNLKEVR